MKEGETIYLDTSALLPLYRGEESSNSIQALLSMSTLPIFISSLTKVEFYSALSRWVRMGEITEVHAALIGSTFESHITAGFFTVRRITTSHYKQAERWLAARRTALRTLDALHLSCSQSLGTELVTLDKTMRQSADLLGIVIRRVDTT